MKEQAGLWIDHREAIIVLLGDRGEEVKKIISGMEKRVRFSGGTASEDGSTEDVRDRQYGNHLNAFYDEVIAVIRGADSIQIFGPGEAKGELEKRIGHAGIKAHILAVEAADKMTDHQVVAKVRDGFSVKNIL
jgi:hypothetical protein